MSKRENWAEAFAKSPNVENLWEGYVEDSEPLNEEVPLEVRFKYLLKENGKLQSYIEELEDTLKNRRLPDSDKVKALKAELILQSESNKKKKEIIRQLKLEVEQLKLEIAPEQLKTQIRNFKRLLVYIEEKYNLDLTEDKKKF